MAARERKEVNFLPNQKLSPCIFLLAYLGPGVFDPKRCVSKKEKTPSFSFFSFRIQTVYLAGGNLGDRRGYRARADRCVKQIFLFSSLFRYTVVIESDKQINGPTTVPFTCFSFPLCITTISPFPSSLPASSPHSFYMRRSRKVRKELCSSFCYGMTTLE